jgi:hypothetical protein
MTMDCHAAACKQGKQVDCGELLQRHQKAMEFITTRISFNLCGPSKDGLAMVGVDEWTRFLQKDNF